MSLLIRLYEPDKTFTESIDASFNNNLQKSLEKFYIPQIGEAASEEDIREKVWGDIQSGEKYLND